MVWVNNNYILKGSLQNENINSDLSNFVKANFFTNHCLSQKIKSARQSDHASFFGKSNFAPCGRDLDPRWRTER